MECKLDGVLRHVAQENALVLSKYVFRLIESVQGTKQRDERLGLYDMDSHDNEYMPTSKRVWKGGIDSNRGYYILHCVKRGDQKPPRKIAVVVSMSADSVLLVCLNDKYHTADKDCFLLVRTK